MGNKKIDFKKSKTANLRLGSVNFFYFYAIAGWGWVKILGVGFSWKDTSLHKLNFSERNGLKKALKIGSWRISLLPCS